MVWDLRLDQVSPSDMRRPQLTAVSFGAMSNIQKISRCGELPWNEQFGDCRGGTKWRATSPRWVPAISRMRLKSHGHTGWVRLSRGYFSLKDKYPCNILQYLAISCNILQSKKCDLEFGSISFSEWLESLIDAGTLQSHWLKYVLSQMQREVWDFQISLCMPWEANTCHIHGACWNIQKQLPSLQYWCCHLEGQTSFWRLITAIVICPKMQKKWHNESVTSTLRSWNKCHHSHG